MAFAKYLRVFGMKKSLTLLLASLLVSFRAPAPPAGADVQGPAADHAALAQAQCPNIYPAFIAAFQEAERLLWDGEAGGAILLMDDMLVGIENCRFKADIPPNILLAAHARFVEACCGNEDYDKAIEILPACLRLFDAESVRGIFAGPVGAMIAKGKTGPAGRLLDEIAAQGNKHPELMELVAMERTVMLWKMNRIPEAELNFVKTASMVSDADLKQVLARIGAQSPGPETEEALSRLCGHVVRNMKGKESARLFAARRLLMCARKSGKPGDIPRIFELLLKSELPRQNLMDLYSMFFYDVAGSGAGNNVKAMLAAGNSLFARLDKPEDKRAVRILELDGLFAMDDFEGALKLVEENRALWEDGWAPITENKIRAHLALQKSDTAAGEKRKQLRLEAVERFRENLKHIARREGKELDPLSGLIYTREMHLGFNLKRIGDILESIGDDAGAAAAFKEAVDCYEKALAETEPGSSEHAFISEILRGIRAGPAGKRNSAHAAGADRNGANDKDARLGKE